MLTPKQPVINAVLITYIDYSIAENYRVTQKERIAFRRCPMAPHAHQIYLRAIPIFGVTSNQIKSKVYIRKPRAVDDLKVSKKLQLCHKECQ